jgi:hypothetical protein
MKKSKVVVGKVRVEFLTEQEVRDACAAATVCPEIFDALLMLAQTLKDQTVADGVECATAGDAQGCLVALAGVRTLELLMVQVADRKQRALSPDGPKGEGEEE